MRFLQVVHFHPCSAGIDLGNREIYVTLNPAITAEMGLPIVHVFGAFTSDLLTCRDLLLNCGVTTVPVEFTFAYRTTIHCVLESSSIENNQVVENLSLKRRVR